MSEVVTTKKKPGELHPRSLPPKRNYRDYLLKFRLHLIRSVSVVLILAVIAFLNSHLIFDEILLAPKYSTFITNVILCKIGKMYDIQNLCFDASSLTIINVNMAGQFLTHLYVSIIAGIVLAFPYILFEIWTFIALLLNVKNRRATIATITSGSILFVLGILFSYFLIVPLTVNFLGTYFVSSEVENTVMLGSYISTVASLILGVGIFFELPIFIYFLAKYGIVSPTWLKRMRRIMIVVILVVSAIITPPDVVSQIMVGIPLLILYEISIFVAKRVYVAGEE